MKYRTETKIIFSRELATRLGPDGWFFRDDLGDGVGQFKTYETGGTIFFFVCPCGCKVTNQIDVQLEKGHGWRWNGDHEKPSLTPSIQMLTPCRWHGHLTRGEWERAAS